MKVIYTAKTDSHVEANVNVTLAGLLGQAKHVVVGYHKKCNDGVTAAAVLRKSIQEYHRGVEKLDFVEMTYSDKDVSRLTRLVDAEDIPQTLMVFVDYCPTPEMLTALTRNFFVIVMDHHDTSIVKATTWYDEQDTATQNKTLLIFDDENTMSGTMIVTGLLPASLVNGAVWHVDNYDRFAKKGNWELSQNVASYIKNIIARETDPLGSIIAVSDYLSTPNAEAMQMAIDYGKNYKSVISALASNVVSDSRTYRDAQGVVRGFMFTADKSMISDIAEEIRIIHPECYFVIGMAMRTTGMEMSVRSSPTSPIDAITIAESFGGGGHKSAAGFTMSPSGISNVSMQISSIVHDLNSDAESMQNNVQRVPMVYEGSCSDLAAGDELPKRTNTINYTTPEASATGCGKEVSPHYSSAGTIKGLVPYSDDPCTGCGEQSTKQTQQSSNGCGCGCS